MPYLEAIEDIGCGAGVEARIPNQSFDQYLRHLAWWMMGLKYLRVIVGT